jgi:hypothetical protein
MFKQIVLALVLCSTAFAQGKSKPAPKVGASPTSEPAPTHIDASTPDAPSSEFPDVVKKGKL